MKLNKIALAAMITLVVSHFANADQGHGKVKFTGSIIDAPCSINPESVDQTVDLGQISNVALQNGGKSTPRPFSLIWKTVLLQLMKQVPCKRIK